MSSISSIQSWFHEPIVLSKEKCRLVAFTALAVFLIGLASYCYVYGGGIYEPGYNLNFAYGVWGIVGSATLCMGIAYIAKAILSRQKIEAHNQLIQNYRNDIGNDLTIPEEALTERFVHLFKTFFPNKEEALIEVQNLIGGTGYFDQHDNLLKLMDQQTNIVRGKQSGRPFLGMRLAIGDLGSPPKSGTLLIAPNRHGYWYVSGSFSVQERMVVNNLIHNESPESTIFIEWLTKIMAGEAKHLLIFNKNWNGNTSSIIEKPDGQYVKLYT